MMSQNGKSPKSFLAKGQREQQIATDKKWNTMFQSAGIWITRTLNKQSGKRQIHSTFAFLFWLRVILGIAFFAGVGFAGAFFAAFLF